MAADYKLVISYDGKIFTGAELETMITARSSELTVPPIPELPTLPPYPAKPVKRIDETQNAFDARYWRWFNEVWLPYQAIGNQRTQLTLDYEVQLRLIFKIACYMKTGKSLPDGRAEYGWIIPNWGVPGKGRITNAPYPQFAMALCGLRKPPVPDPVYWICFKSLYT